MNLPSKLLAIDTATNNIYIALLIDGQIVDQISQAGTSNHSVTILPLIESLLTKQNMDLKAIEGLLIGIGPGSYTGVRIGVAIAKMIGYLNQIPVYSFSSLALLASASPKSKIIASIDARRGNAFMAAFEQKNGILTVTKSDILMNVEDFKNALPVQYEIVTEGFPDVSKVIQSGLLASVADIHSLVPNYLQITEAERNKELAV
jgi:tRNA threonylcarbamoyladenosine biosynthesis protein TsaB